MDARQILIRIGVALCFALVHPGAIAQSCPPEGSGTHNDPKQNVLKNRDAVPDSCEEMTVTAFKKKFEPNLHLPTRRENFSDDQINLVTPSEQGCVTLRGYILRAVKQGPESANCGDPKRTDIHIWVYGATRQDKDQRTGLRGKAVVVEVTPRWFDNHPDWTHIRLEKIARDRLRVKISGWVMYDPEHPPHMGKTRGTLWELHPVTSIQYWDGTAWRDL